MSDKPEITASWSVNHGGCNNCSQLLEPVCVIRIRSLEVRLCPSCKADLQGLFTQLGKSRAPKRPYDAAAHAAAYPCF